MRLRDDIGVAIANLYANKMRSLFSMLGVIIGTASVILVISIVNGTRIATLEKNQVGNENLIRVIAAYDDANERFGSLDMGDLEDLRRLPHVRGAYPLIRDNNALARGTSGRAKVNLSGVDFFHADLFRMEILSGRFFTKNETMGRPRICVISDKVVEALFGFDYPIGQRLRIDQLTLEVVGVFKAEHRLTRMGEEGNVLIPFYTLYNILKRPRLFTIRVQAEEGKVEQLKNEVLAWRERAQKQKEVTIRDPRDDQKDINQWAKSWLMQMTFVASISLFVGGIGLMNVMLTTVAERTHEIGLRKALGADSKAILTQFLVESATLSTVGGLMGIISGVVLSYVVEVMSEGRIFVAVLPLSLFLSVAFSILTGVLFGLYPASNASRLSPVEALRYD